ncbi:MAG: DNA internalization-related competence protein ComEC/Rec2 [Lachnospiraceae bacterium]|nr:DNA internalization-related competence protein ComEC/Rec2 [Lachnospiraceae bacterium]
MRRPMCLPAASFLLCLMLLIPVFYKIPQDYDRIPEIAEREQVYVTGTFTGLSEKEDKIVVKLKDVSFTDAPVFSYFAGEQAAGETYGLLLYLPKDKDTSFLKISCRISAGGTFRKFQAAENEGQFHTRKYYFRKGVDGYLTDPVIYAVSTDSAPLRQRLYEVRRDLREIIFSYLDPEDAGILSALLLGDRDTLDEEVRDLYQNAGIAHILSLSGLHVAAFGLGLLKLILSMIRKLFVKTALCDDLGSGGGKSLAVSAVISGLLLFLWCMMTGFGVSTVRAFVMFALGIVANLKHRTYDLLSAAAFSSIVAAILDPLSIYEAGFQLSFMAVCSIGVLMPLAEEILGNLASRKIVAGILVSLSIQAGTLPVVSWHYYQVPFCGILLNLLVVPLLSLVLLLGVMLTLCGLLCAAGPVSAGFMHLQTLPDLACRLFAYIIHLIFSLYKTLCAWTEKLPYGGILVTGRPSVWQIVVYYVLLGIAVIVTEQILRRRKSRAGEKKRILVNDRIGRHNIVLQNAMCKVRECLILCGILIIATVIITYRPREDLEVRNLSVGQGDCTLVFSKTHVIVVDCGSSSQTEVGERRLVPCLKANGVRKVNGIYISHFDSDHVNGILELLNDPVYAGRIEKLVISALSPVFDGETDNYKQLLLYANERGIPVYLMREKDEVIEGTIVLQALSPCNDASLYEDTNAASLVLLLVEEKTGYRVLLTGDIGSETEELILRRFHFSCDYLKVAHHGSGYSSKEAFLREAFDQKAEDRSRSTYNNNRYRLKYAVISVGAHNRYGHPHAETLERLEDVDDLMICRTDQSGETILKVHKNAVFMGFFQ